MQEYTINDDGTKAWYLDDKLHRTDGPAIDYVNGYKEWYQNGKLHRLDGPAIECVNGTKYWYLNGVKVTEQDMMKKDCSDKINIVEYKLN